MNIYIRTLLPSIPGIERFDSLSSRSLSLRPSRPCRGFPAAPFSTSPSALLGMTVRYAGNSDDFYGALRKRLHEGAAVGPGHDPIIEDDDDATVAFRADQAADALTQFQHRFRQRIFGKRIATALLDQLKFC